MSRHDDDSSERFAGFGVAVRLRGVGEAEAAVVDDGRHLAGADAPRATHPGGPGRRSLPSRCPRSATGGVVDIDHQGGRRPSCWRFCREGCMRCRPRHGAQADSGDIADSRVIEAEVSAVTSARCGACLRRSQGMRTTRPNGRPDSRCRWALAASASGKVRSMATRSSPVATRRRRSATSS
jgi:hypothetical protein